MAAEFVDWLVPRRGFDWLDVGCGTGALAGTVAARAAPRSVVGIDPSAAFVAHASRMVLGKFAVGDAQALPFRDGSFDAVVSGLVLNFVPDTGRGLAEMGRVSRTGGIVAAYVWDYAGEMQLMRRFWDAAVALDPHASEQDEGRRFAICSSGSLANAFSRAGLRDVAVRPIDVPTVFMDFDDYWTPFLGGQAPAPAYAMSLDEPARARLRERLRASLPIAPDGSISLIARAWAVRGTVA